MGSAVLGGQQTPAPSPADTLFQSGFARLSQGKYQEAEEAFRKVYEMEPANSRGILAVAEVYVAQKKDDEALRLLQAEAGKNPARLDLHIGIGNVALHAAKYDLAIAEFQGVLEGIDKNSRNAGDLYFRLGETYRRKGDLDFSIAVLRQAQKLQPANAAISNTLAFVLDSVGQKQAAAAEYRMILDLDPNNGLVMNNLAFLLADEGTDLDMALAYAHRARQLFPNEPTVADTLGWVYLKMNRAEDAVAIFRDIVQKNPSRATYHYHLAAALDRKGDHSAALKELETALNSNPSKDDEQKIKGLLQKISK
jgi:tetratricopeptide (TPR) repeat protein